MTGLARLIVVLFFMAGAHPSMAQGLESLSITGVLPPTPQPRLEWGKDPFVPLVRGVKVPELRLTAIFYNPERPSVIIDETILYIHSVIEGQEVVDIRESHVMLKGEGGTFRLELVGLAEFSK